MINPCFLLQLVITDFLSLMSTSVYLGIVGKKQQKLQIPKPPPSLPHTQGSHAAPKHRALIGDGHGEKMASLFAKRKKAEQLSAQSPQ